MSGPAIAQSLARLAQRAGLMTEWEDALGTQHQIAESTVRTLLGKLGLPCEDDAQIEASHALLDREQSASHVPPLVTATLGEAIVLPASGLLAGSPYRITLEGGGTAQGTLTARADGALTLAAIDRMGYHQLELAGTTSRVAVAPARCYAVQDALTAQHGKSSGRPSAAPPAPATSSAAAASTASPASIATPASAGSAGSPAPRERPPRAWGIGVQLYGLRRAADGGLGDYTALAEAARRAAGTGAAALALSPVHAMFSAQLDKISPYSPSSKLFLNVLHIDPAQRFGSRFARESIEALGLSDELEALDKLDLIDWPAAGRARLAVLRHLFERFTSGAAPDQDAAQADFASFRHNGGSALEDHARFEALHAHLLAQNPKNGHWAHWPEALRTPTSPAVARFAAEHAREVEFHVFLQWLAACGLRAAQRQAREAGMAIGLIADLAVGCDSSGSHAWGYPEQMLQGVSVGAPPDLFNQAGQAWGLTTFSPRAMHAQGFSAFIDMLRAAFAHAGGVRIDHILGLQRLWLVPEGAPAKDGAYLHYPLQDLLRLIALESWRHRAIVIGEDLGTVPPGFRERLSAAGLLGIRVLWFERTEDETPGFAAPPSWPGDAIATTTTHDLPTVTGWWEGRDVTWRARIGQTVQAEGRPDPMKERAADRAQLWKAFQQAGVTSAQTAPPAIDDAPVDEAIVFIGSTPAPLAIYPLEDLLGLADQPNLPGSIDEHPNWRRRITETIDEIFDDGTVADRLKSIDSVRKHKHS